MNVKSIGPLAFALFVSSLMSFAAQDHDALPRDRRVESGLTGRELQKRTTERSKGRNAREKRLANTPIEMILAAAPAQIKPLILERMVERKATFISGSEFRLSFSEPVAGSSRDWKTWVTLGYYAGPSVPSPRTMRPELHIDFLLIPLGAETDVRVLCATDENSPHHHPTISARGRACGRKTLGLIELLESVKAELPN